MVAHDGSVDVDVTVVQGNDQRSTKNIHDEAKKRVSMFIRAKDGRIKARLVSLLFALSPLQYLDLILPTKARPTALLPPTASLNLSRLAC